MSTGRGPRAVRGPRPDEHTRRVLLAAAHEAAAAGHDRIGSEHLLLGLLTVGRGGGADWLRREGPTAPAVRGAVRRAVDERGGDPGGSTSDDLAVFGLDDVTVPPGRVRPGRARRRRAGPDYAEEADAVLARAREQARIRPSLQRSRRRPLDEDALATALATTRGTRARDLLPRLGVDPEGLRRAAGRPPTAG